MGFDPVTAAIAIVTTVYSASEQRKAQKEAASAAGRAADEQKKARQEQMAQNAAQAAQERRQQIREERVRRAKVIQASANTGTTGSSGEIGAEGALATQLSSNLGYNAGMLASSNRVSQYNQNAADFMNSAQNSIADANEWGQIGGVSMSIFNATGGFNAFKPGTQAPAPVETRTPKKV